MNSKAIKFLNAYDESDIDSFYGRPDETQELFEKVKKSRLTLLYGLSGTGKTSLVQCGLASKFSSNTWLPVLIRRGDNIVVALRTAIDQKAKKKTPPHRSLVDALNNLYLDHFVPITLIFDQFEELFISGDKEETDAFVSILANILQGQIGCNVIIIVREEYLAYFDSFEKIIPAIFNNRMRLERMRRHVIEEVIGKIIEAPDNDKNLVSRMADNISDKKGNIELTYLQIYLDKLFHSNIKEYNIETIESVGKLENILGNFLEEQIKLIIDEYGNKEIVWSILKNLITEDGTKKPVSIKDLKTLFKESEWVNIIKYLDSLEKSRIIKKDSGYYELTHDSLATKISEHLTAEEKTLVEVKRIISNATNAYSRTGALMGKEQLSYIKNFESRLSDKLSNDQVEVISLSHRKYRKNRRLKIFSLVVLIVSLLAFGSHESVVNRTLKRAKTNLSQQICLASIAEADRLFLAGSFDSALAKLNYSLIYCDSSLVNRKIRITESRKKNEFHLKNIWNPEIDIFEKNKDYIKAILTCDSVLKVFQNDDYILSRKHNFIKIQFKELTTDLEPWTKIPDLWQSGCENLIRADSLKLYDSAFFIENQYDTLVSYFFKKFQCKSLSNGKDSVDN